MISEFEILQTENAKQINLIIFNFYDKIFKSYHQMIIVTKKNIIINEKNIQEFAIDPLKTNNINIEQFRIKYKNIENKIENYKKIMEEGIKKIQNHEEDKSLTKEKNIKIWKKPWKKLMNRKLRNSKSQYKNR